MQHEPISLRKYNRRNPEARLAPQAAELLKRRLRRRKLCTNTQSIAHTERLDPFQLEELTRHDHRKNIPPEGRGCP